MTAGPAVEEAFAKVVGRQPSEAERGRLYRIRDALGLRDNDAFWYIVMVLEHYDALYRDYPSLIREEARRTIEEARRAFAAAAEVEAAKAQTALAQQVAETSVAIARKLAERPVGAHRVTAMFAAAVAFGALCMTAGFKVGGGAGPLWWSTNARGGGASVAALVLGAPAGWMVFAFVLPVAFYGVRTGWIMAHEGTAKRVGRGLGWGLVGVCVVATAACAVALVRML
jgi:hypothetical protein